MPCEEGPSEDEVCGVDIVSWPSVAWELSLEVVCGAVFVLLQDSWLPPVSAAMPLTAGACWEAVWALMGPCSFALFSMSVAVAFGFERVSMVARARYVGRLITRCNCLEVSFCKMDSLRAGAAQRGLGHGYVSYMDGVERFRQSRPLGREECRDEATRPLRESSSQKTRPAGIR